MKTHTMKQSINIDLNLCGLRLNKGDATLKTLEQSNNEYTLDVTNLSPHLDSIGYWNTIGGGVGKIRPDDDETTETKLLARYIWLGCNATNKNRYLNSLNRNEFFIRYFASVANKSGKLKGKNQGTQIKGIYQKIGRPIVKRKTDLGTKEGYSYDIFLKIKRIDTIKPFQFHMKKDKPNPYGWKFYGWIDRSDVEGKKDGIMFVGCTGNVIHRHPIDVVRNIQENKSIVIQRFIKNRLGSKEVLITEDERIELEKTSRETLL